MISLSSISMEDAAYSALGKGLNNAVSPAVLPIEDFLTGVEEAIVYVPVEAAEEARQDTLRILKALSRPSDNLSGAERKALRSLRTNADLTVLHAHKVIATVFNTTDYNENISVLIRAPTYRKLAKDSLTP
jgi:hypothetical protein